MAGPLVAFQSGVHGSRPAASSGCVWYWCTTHSKVYRSDGTSWADLQDLSALSGGFADPMTTRGDIIVRNSSNATARLAVGSANKFVHSDGTDVAWASVLPADLDVSADNTTANSTSGHHGLLPKLSGSSSDVLKGDGTWATAGGSGLAQSFAGYNTVGGTWTTTTSQRYYNKKFTLASSALVVSVDVHLRPSTDAISGGAAVITQDNSNAPGILVAGTSTTAAASTGGMYLSNSGSMPGTGRWVSFAVGAYLPAGDYWAGFVSAGTAWDLANDGSGSDQIFTMTGSNFIVSGAYPSAWALSDSTRKYSIRICLLA